MNDVILDRAFCCREGFDYHDTGNEILIALNVKQQDFSRLLSKCNWTQDQNSKGVYSWIVRSSFKEMCACQHKEL